MTAEERNARRLAEELIARSRRDEQSVRVELSPVEYHALLTILEMRCDGWSVHGATMTTFATEDWIVHVELRREPEPEDEWDVPTLPRVPSFWPEALGAAE